MQAESSCDVGIVGCGPRGLHVLQCIAASNGSIRAKSVQVFETATNLGAGNVYAHGQPDYLIMNSDCSNYTFYSSAFAEKFPKLVQSFREFSEAYSLPLVPYPSRSSMGRYLSSCFDTVYKCLRESGVSVKRRSTEVTSVERYGDNWRIEAGYDEKSSFWAKTLFVCTGHAVARHDGSGKKSLALGIYSSRWPEIDKPKSSRFIITGASLTAIDAILHIAYRSDLFLEDAIDRPESSSENVCPPLIEIFAKSQKFILPKTKLETKYSTQIRHAFESSLTLSELKQGSVSQWDRKEFEDAMSAMVAITCSLYNYRNVDLFKWLTHWDRLGFAQTISLGRKIVSDNPWQDRDATVAIVIGEMFRYIVPYLRKRFDYGNSTPAQRQWLQHLCSRLEKIAFGPPAKNYRKILYLVDKDILQFVSEADNSVSRAYRVDAYLPAYRQCVRGGILEKLRGDLIVDTDEATGAIKTDKSGRAIDTVGTAVLNLYIFSRACEYWALNHDSLQSIQQHDFGEIGFGMSAQDFRAQITDTSDSNPFTRETFSDASL